MSEELREILKDIGNEEAKYIATETYNYLVDNGLYNPIKLPKVKEYAIMYSSLMKIQRDINRNGFDSDEDRESLINLQDKLSKRTDGIYKILESNKSTQVSQVVGGGSTDVKTSSIFTPPS